MSCSKLCQHFIIFGGPIVIFKQANLRVDNFFFFSSHFKIFFIFYNLSLKCVILYDFVTFI